MWISIEYYQTSACAVSSLNHMFSGSLLRAALASRPCELTSRTAYVRLYLGFDMLILMGLDHISRFWTLFESWLAMQRV